MTSTNNSNNPYKAVDAKLRSIAEVGWDINDQAERYLK